jgi:hypothetical protein
VLDAVDIAIKRRLLLLPTNEDSIDPDYPPACANHPDLVVTNVAFDVVEVARFGVGNDRRLRGQCADFLEASRIDMREIEHDPESLALPHHVPTEAR